MHIYVKFRLKFFFVDLTKNERDELALSQLVGDGRAEVVGLVVQAVVAQLVVAGGGQLAGRQGLGVVNQVVASVEDHRDGLGVADDGHHVLHNGHFLSLDYVDIIHPVGLKVNYKSVNNLLQIYDKIQDCCNTFVTFCNRIVIKFRLAICYGNVKEKLSLR